MDWFKAFKAVRLLAFKISAEPCIGGGH
jgi:hypothetical protein